LATASPSAQLQAGQPGLSVDGVDHLAFVTWRPRATYEFCTRALGMPLVHAITATGWVTEDYPDFVHFFFDMGKGNRIAFFYYFGLPEEGPPSDLMHRTRHVAFQRQQGRAMISLRYHAAMLSHTDPGRRSHGKSYVRGGNAKRCILS
jgi:catechol 2,3-dioxygenase-like lactoylglutathione lyase family enzyme